MIHGVVAVITDRFTAQVLGTLLIVLTLVIDVSCFLFIGPERRGPAFPIVVIGPSLPLLLGGCWLIWRADKLKPED